MTTDDWVLVVIDEAIKVGIAPDGTMHTEDGGTVVYWLNCCPDRKFYAEIVVYDDDALVVLVSNQPVPKAKEFSEINKENIETCIAVVKRFMQGNCDEFC